MGTKNCKFCDKTGLLILPLRYAAVVGDSAALISVPALPATLGAGVKDIALTQAKYAPRMMREGYIYMLTERDGLKYWEGYLVVDDAFLYKFDVSTPPTVTVAFSCEPSVCGIDASCIAIPKVEMVSKVYFLFTPTVMTEAKLKEYKDHADAYVVKGKMQAFDPKAWAKAGSRTQEHSLKPELLSTKVPEWMLYQQCAAATDSVMGKVLERQLFPALNAAYAGVPAPSATEPAPGRLGILAHKLQKKEGAVFVLYDHIGITQELNDYRNDAFIPIDTFMGKKEKNVSNTYRFDVYNAIGKVRTAIESGVVADAQSSVELADMKRRAMRGAEPIFRDDTPNMRRFKMQANNAYTHPSRQEWEASNQNKVAAFEDARDRDEQNMIDSAPARAQKMWHEQISPVLDVAEIDRFNNALNKLGPQTRTEADARSPQHMAWLQSARVLNAFDAYDPKHAGSGELLQAHVVGCIFGMEGSPQAEGVLTEWATATSIKRENLLLRAFTRNQDAVKKEADKALADVTALVAGMTTMAAVPSTGWKTATKGLVSAVKSTDSALDEWMRNQGQNSKYVNPKHLANAEARFFYLISTMTRAVARKGMGGKLEMAVAARANAIMHSFLGDLAHEIEYKKLTGSIDPAKWDDLKQKHANADKLAKASASRKTAMEKRAYRQALKAKAALQMAAIDLMTDAQLKGKLELAKGAKKLGWTDLQSQMETSAQQHTGYQKAAKALENAATPAERVPATPSPTNNYHQARIGGALAGIEAVSLLTKLPELLKDNWGAVHAEALASALSLSSITLDMMYAYTKSVRELPAYAAIHGVNKGADIVRGGFKLSAGLLAATAGMVTAVLDWQKAKAERDVIQKSILYARSVTSSVATLGGTLAAYSYAGPLLEHLAKKTNTKLDRSIRFAKGLGARRVALLRVVAWLGWVGVAITVVDLSYAGYRWYMDSTALERWFARCVFRKNKSNQPYSDMQEELKEFAKALHPGQEYDDAPAEVDLAKPQLQIAEA